MASWDDGSTSTPWIGLSSPPRSPSERPCWDGLRCWKAGGGAARGPGALDYMAGTVRSTNLFGVPLVNLSRTGLGPGMKALKRFVDIVGSAVALVLLSPFSDCGSFGETRLLGLCFTVKSALGCMASRFTSSSSERWFKMRRGTAAAEFGSRPRITPWASACARRVWTNCPSFGTC